VVCITASVIEEYVPGKKEILSFFLSNGILSNVISCMFECIYCSALWNKVIKGKKKDQYEDAFFFSQVFFFEKYNKKSAH